MLYHTCTECHRGFIATSFDEATEGLVELKGMSKEQADKFEGGAEELVYAKFCPYCGGKAIEAR